MSSVSLQFFFLFSSLILSSTFCVPFFHFILLSSVYFPPLGDLLTSWPWLHLFSSPSPSHFLSPPVIMDNDPLSTFNSSNFPPSSFLPVLSSVLFISWPPPSILPFFYSSSLTLFLSLFFSLSFTDFETNSKHLLKLFCVSQNFLFFSLLSRSVCHSRCQWWIDEATAWSWPLEAKGRDARLLHSHKHTLTQSHCA